MRTTVAPDFEKDSVDIVIDTTYGKKSEKGVIPP